MVILGDLLLIIFIISLIVFINRYFKVLHFVMKNRVIQENIVVMKNFKGLTYLTIIASIAFIINSISFVILTYNSLFFYIYFVLTSLLEIALIESFFLIKHLTRKKLDLKLYTKKAHRTNMYFFLSFIIYFVVYAYVVLHFSLFK
jgi:hypothetical protein